MKRIFVVMALALALAAAPVAPARAAEQRSSSPVIWTWDPGANLGTSTLVRTQSGLSATFHSSQLTPGHAVTLWFIIFNNPGACYTTPCSVQDVLFNPDAQADFLAGGGHVIGASGSGNFGGHLEVGDISGSGKTEIGMPAVGLLDPLNAEVHLALHSHGPAVPGPGLPAMISTFTGGCAVFLGPFGIAGGPADVPDAVGECSTIQASIHL
jgi:hypothetical protein